MWAIVPFRRWHYEWLVAARKTGEGKAVTLNEGLLERLEAANTWTAVADGDPIAVAGTVMQWPGRHLAWAYLGEGTGPHMTWLTLATERNLSKLKGRIEATVRVEFEAGHRWMRLLKFQVETPEMKGFGPQGEAHAGYVRFN